MGCFLEELQFGVHTDTAKRRNLERGVLLAGRNPFPPSGGAPVKASSCAKFKHYNVGRLSVYIVCLSHGEADSL